MSAAVIPPVPGSTPPGAPTPGTDANTKYVSKSNVVVALIGLAGVLVTAWLGRSDDGKTPERPPTLRINTVEWVGPGNDGRYNVKGHADDLQQGQLVWTYNQPLSDQDRPGAVYPDLGPCPVDDKGNFSCSLGFAGGGTGAGKRFRIWAAVVTDEQAYQAAEVKGKLVADEKQAAGGKGSTDRNALGSFATPENVPHVEGTATMVSVDKQRPPAG